MSAANQNASEQAPIQTPQPAVGAGLEGRAWLAARLKRHISEVARLSLPVMMTRLGLLSVAMVDIAMVGHYATEHLAWLNLANQSGMMFMIVVALGLLMGVLICTSTAFGRSDMLECGRVWRRSLPFATFISVLCILAALPAPTWIGWLGQTPDNASHAGALLQILALGLPGHVYFIVGSMFLEGVNRASIGFYVMLGANLVNILANYALIFGHFGMPEMGAEGSAWASTIVRWFMALAVNGAIWFGPSFQRYGVRLKVSQSWASWAHQRRMGYASAVSITTEVVAFAALAVFAGWIGTVELASHGVLYQFLGVPLMMAIGIGVATGVRVGVAHGRRDTADTALAGISGLLFSAVISISFTLIILYWTRDIVMLFTDDARIADVLVPLALVFTVGMIFDALQMILSFILRGMSEAWVPTILQGTAFLGVMLPACYYLAIVADRGFKGLVEGTALGVLVACFLGAARFYYLIKHSDHGAQHNEPAR